MNATGQIFFLPWTVEILPQCIDQNNHDSDYISGMLTLPVEKEKIQSANQFLCLCDAKQSIAHNCHLSTTEFIQSANSVWAQGGTSSK